MCIRDRRGVSKRAQQLRPGINIIQGRFPIPGTTEVMVGTAINRKFQGTDLGQAIRMVGSDWPIVGIFDAGLSLIHISEPTRPY